MDQILAMREKRAKLWDATKAFLDSKRNGDGLISAEDNATYEKMEADVIALGHEIERMERQAAIDREMNAPTSKPLTGKPQTVSGDTKTGRATDEYKSAFWNIMRKKAVPHEVYNALQVGTLTEGGYLAPDEYEHTLIEALQDQNIFRSLARVISTLSRRSPPSAESGPKRMASRPSLSRP